MDINKQIKPISYLKSHAADIVKQFDDAANGPIIITQNGEAKMVVMSIKYYQDVLEQNRQGIEQLAFMKLLALGTKELAEGNFVSEEEFFADLEKDE